MKFPKKNLLRIGIWFNSVVELCICWKKFLSFEESPPHSAFLSPLTSDLSMGFSDDSCDDFGNTFGHNSGFSLNDVLWTCSNMFSNR